VAKTFEEAWAEKEAEGYQYGEEALEQVRFGWDIAKSELTVELRTLRVCNVANILELHRADALIGTMRLEVERLQKALRDAAQGLKFHECRSYGDKRCVGCELAEATQKAAEKEISTEALVPHAPHIAGPSTDWKIRGVDFPCENCGQLAGSGLDNGWYRCSACGYPGK
jgi:hypothetical protein